MYCQLVVAVVVAAVFAVLAVVVVFAVVVMIGAVVDVVSAVAVIAAVVFSCLGEQDFKSIMNRFFGLYGRLKLKL